MKAHWIKCTLRSMALDLCVQYYHHQEQSYHFPKSSQQEQVSIRHSVQKLSNLGLDLIKWVIWIGVFPTRPVIWIVLILLLMSVVCLLSGFPEPLLILLLMLSVIPLNCLLFRQILRGVCPEMNW